MVKKIFLSVGVALLCINWSNDPAENTPVCTAPGGQYAPQIVSDGAGGAIIAWKDWSDEDGAGIYAQRIDSSGQALWSENGVVVYSSTSKLTMSSLVSDSHGGVVFAYGIETQPHSNNYATYMMRIDPTGGVLWSSAEIGGTIKSSSYKLVPNGLGGGIVFWEEKRDDTTKIYAQHVGGDGQIRWTAGGIRVSTAEGYQHRSRADADGKGGAFVVWMNQAHDHFGNDVYAQRIDAAGTLSWGHQGVVVFEGAPHFTDPGLAADDQEGVFTAWPAADYSSEIRMQHLDAGGNRLWPEEGRMVYRLPDYYYYDISLNRIVFDKKGGIYLLIEGSEVDYLCGSYSYYEANLQRVDASGTVKWGEKGVSIYSDTTYRTVVLISDEAGGAIAAWESSENNDILLKAQRFDRLGVRHWAEKGLTVATERFGRKNQTKMVSDGAGGAIITWQTPGSGTDIYVQNVCSSGGLGSCAHPIALIDGSRFGGIVPVTIHFDGSGSYDPDGKIRRWRWNLGEGQIVSGEKVSHTYDQTGTYHVTLRVKDDSGRWSSDAKAMVKIFSLDGLEVTMGVTSTAIKARARGKIPVIAVCKEKATDPDREERPIPVDLGLDFSSTAGSWDGEASFVSGIYYRILVSGAPGIAAVKAVLEGETMATINMEFTWPLPPVNLQVELKANRSLFRGEYYAYLSWAANPDEVFTVDKYRIYRSTNGGSMELVTEVDAGTLTYVDPHLPLGSQYAYALSMVDIEGDESAPSAAVSAAK